MNILLLSIIPVLQFVFVYFLFLKPIQKYSFIFRKLFFVLLGISALNGYLYIFFKMTTAYFGIPKWLVMIVLNIFWAMAVLCILIGIRLVLNFLFKLLRRNFSVNLFKPESVILSLFMTALSFYISAVAVSNGFVPPVIRNYTFTVDKLSVENSGLKIVQLSDLHIDGIATKSEIRDIVDRVNEQKPDLVLITGDFVDGKVSDLKDVTDILFDLDSKYGVYAVPGNHEYYSDYRKWLEYFEKGGIKFLENNNISVKDYAKNNVLNLCGITDPTAEHYNMTEPSIKDALVGVDNSVPTIFMSHRPKFAVQLQEFSDLTLCGHTHGGFMPGIDILVGLLNEGMTHGLYKLGKEKVIVSSGTRINTASAFRIFNKPVINIIVLESPKAHRNLSSKNFSVYFES